MIRARFTPAGKHSAADGEHTGILEIEPGQLGRVFYVPSLGAWIGEQEDSP